MDISTPMMPEKISFKRMFPEAIQPTRGTQYSAGYDLYVPKDTIINPGRNIIRTGLVLDMKPGTYADIRPRSGFSAKGFVGEQLPPRYFLQRWWRVLKEIFFVPKTRFDCDVLLGTIDEDYTGSVGIVVNNRDEAFLCKAGTRAAQIVINRYESYEFVRRDFVKRTQRGDGGFGHTGNK